MEIEIADIVISLNGRDKDKYFIVVGLEDEFLHLADGKTRRLERPKRKKNKHIKPDGKIVNHVANKLRDGDKVTNNEIRRTLAEYIATNKQT